MGKDILTDLANLSHYERHPKSRIGLIVLLNALSAILLFCSVRALYLYFVGQHNLALLF